MRPILAAAGLCSPIAEKHTMADLEAQVGYYDDRGRWIPSTQEEMEHQLNLIEREDEAMEMIWEHKDARERDRDGEPVIDDDDDQEVFEEAVRKGMRRCDARLLLK